MDESLMRADYYSWNYPCIERSTIETFLRLAHDRIDKRGDRLAFDPKDGRQILNWLHGLIDLKPSELTK